MLMLLKFELLYHANDTCLVFQSGNVTDIEKQSDDILSNMQWYAANNLSIHIGKDETKSIDFDQRQKIKKVSKLNITFSSKAMRCIAPHARSIL